MCGAIVPPYRRTALAAMTALLMAAIAGCEATGARPTTTVASADSADTSWWCALGTTSTCVGAWGLMSRKASVASVSCTTSGWMAPDTNWQNRHSSSDMRPTLDSASRGRVNRRRSRGVVLACTV